MPVMPDTRIPLSGDDGGGGGRSSFSSPLQTLGAMMQIKEQQQQFEARRRAFEDDTETRNALQQCERPEDAIEHLWKTGRPSAAANLSKDVLGERTAKWQESDAQLKLQGTPDRAGLAAARVGD